MNLSELLRPGLGLISGYHSPQVEVDVRLNTNESPFPPPEAWRQELCAEVARIEFQRYPDREVRVLREALAQLHGLEADRVFCANGSNEALQCLMLAYGGPGRRVNVFEPTYTLHGHIARLSGAEVVAGERDGEFVISLAEVDRVLEGGGAASTVTFLCSPNNPTGRADPVELVRHVLDRSPGLVLVDEAYGQFSEWSAADLLVPAAVPEPDPTIASPDGGEADALRRLVVARTFSKTWSMAAVRLGYLLADPEVVRACEHVVLPYHLSSLNQAAGVLALRYRSEMEERVSLISAERDRLAAALGSMAVQTWPSAANFILFRPLEVDAAALWQGLLDRSVLVRDFSMRPDLPGCLRVTVGTPQENDRFLEALEAVL